MFKILIAKLELFGGSRFIAATRRKELGCDEVSLPILDVKNG
jgi:hypothetical protein